jgi:hypothetical protein
MSSAGSLFLVALVMGTCLFAAADMDTAESRERGQAEPRVITDGRLRPGHLETIRVAGFPGRGAIEVSFFPTAICEDGCGARSFGGGRTNANGAATFRVRVPGTFLDPRDRLVYFRDGERIDVNVTWEGAHRSFAFASAEPEPIIVRTYESRRG